MIDSSMKIFVNPQDVKSDNNRKLYMHRLAFSMIFGFLLTGCHTTVPPYTVKELKELTIVPELGNFAVRVRIKGYMRCSGDIYLLRNGAPTSDVLHNLTGSIDTIYETDWYDSTLSFGIRQDTCFDVSTRVFVELLFM